MIYGERLSRKAVMFNRDGTEKEFSRIPFLSKSYNESWLQQIIDEHPNLIPAKNFGDKYYPLISIGREIEVGSEGSYGYIDNLLISPSGYLVIVETKLFRNQESKRSVVAQIIDYAKEIQKWDAERLDKAIAPFTLKKYGQAMRVVDVLAREGMISFSDEAELIDNINRNLENASFLLAIVGDGIRSGVQQMVDFLTENSAFSFEMAMIELELYDLDSGVIVIPNVLNKTTVVERYRFVSEPAPFKAVETSTSYQQKPVLSRREFIDRFADIGGYDSDDITAFIADAEIIDGVFINIAPTELQIKFQMGKNSEALLTFGIPEYKNSDLYIRPDRFKKKLDISGIFSNEADDFWEFCKPYVDLQKCKAPPYEWGANRFYYLDTSRVLANASLFIGELDKLAAKIRE